MKDNLGLILGALSVLIAFPILFWVAREPAPPEQKPAPGVYAAKTAVQGNGPSVTLGWSANTEPGLAGYKIYYKTESKIPPYDGKGLTEGDSPIVVPLERLGNPNNPEFALHGLNKDKTYFFAITAYDSAGGESGLSESIAFKSPSAK
jgi:hypothetical protein